MWFSITREPVGEIDAFRGDRKRTVWGRHAEIRSRGRVARRAREAGRGQGARFVNRASFLPEAVDSRANRNAERNTGLPAPNSAATLAQPG